MTLSEDPVNKNFSFSATRRGFFRLVLPWAGLITLTAYSRAKSRWLDRMVWRAGA